MKVVKTVKLFIDGQFPRTESGRSFELKCLDGAEKYANICQASRKDFRNAVVAAKKAQGPWSKRTSYNRGQILYRMAEMLTGRKEEFVSIIAATLEADTKKAEKQIEDCVKAMVYFAGFADKYQQVLGSENPVSSPHYNFTTSEPMGVVAWSGSGDTSFSDMVSDLLAIILSGNTVVALLPLQSSALLAPFAEVLQTSDLPGGVINLLSGFTAELLPVMASHMEVNALSLPQESSQEKELQEMAVENMKRLIWQEPELSLRPISQFIEYKTIWHPIGT